MNHLSEEQLVLYYYGESGTAEVEEHIGECESCRGAYHTLQRVLNSVDSLPVPERGADYEARVWRKLSTQLPRKRSFTMRWFTWKPLAAAAAMAGLMIAAFFAGHSWQKPRTEAAKNDVRERVLLVAVGDHLERSQMMLVELSNADAKQGALDISYEQQAAEDLIESNRLYRQTAASAGDTATASLLEDLERVLLEVAHSPSTVSEGQLDDLRKEIESRGILMKVKVFGEQVERRQAAPQSGGVL